MSSGLWAHAHTQALLDRIWKSELPRVQAARLVLSDLKGADILILSRYQLEAEMGALISFSDMDFHTCSMKIAIALNGLSTTAFTTQETNGLMISQFTDVSWSLEVRDASFLTAINQRFRASAASILATIQYCRDHVDSTLYLPQELRSQQLDRESQDLGVPVAFLKSLAVSYRNTERSLEAVN